MLTRNISSQLRSYQLHENHFYSSLKYLILLQQSYQMDKVIYIVNNLKQNILLHSKFIVLNLEQCLLQHFFLLIFFLCIISAKINLFLTNKNILKYSISKSNMIRKLRQLLGRVLNVLSKRENLILFM
ncbi:transmembrane protein, putative (macronuclear) [Tetrahymena thermophila SB210]|uniref:Transmembrane protein, putative n=1 Tax=Tetrahymena thermophila (strain SB210) TaxID=312017 RepID=W7XEU6_TETTS|nr:transmembrane protein, putative [Tetrahymena thermophila SB210]EWS72476.1 transmembrane protein, putative [Tetrahymena thermophila SB210]|eukprot:XP_012654973.1 transmembrane protein, putative [Tetrahymena thermophila SB210]